MLTVTIIFIIAMALQIPSFGVNDSIKIIVFVAWAAYGVVPTFHWACAMGWFESPVVTVSLYFYDDHILSYHLDLVAVTKSTRNVRNQRHRLPNLYHKNSGKVGGRKIRLYRTFSSMVAFFCGGRPVLLAQHRYAVR